MKYMALILAMLLCLAYETAKDKKHIHWRYDGVEHQFGWWVDK